MKISAFSRSLELAKLAAKVGFKELRSGDIKSRMKQAAMIAQSLSQLKGAAMKAGQLLSLDLTDYFPPEALEVLSQLQNAAVAQPFSQMQTALHEELGPEKTKLIEDISIKPIGVASIGQVHRARFKGQDIVLKIQYPGVSDSIDSDLKILKTIASSFCQMTGRKMKLDPLFQEFNNILNQEVDYGVEAKFQKEYSLLVNKLHGKVDYELLVPEIIPELSTKRIIAMSYEKGVTLKSWIASNPEMKKRESLAHIILDLYFHEFFHWGLVQTDPNLANFLIQETDSNFCLVLLDFGATRRYSTEFIRDYIQLLHLAAEGDSVQLKKHAIEFGLIDPRESTKAFFAFEQILKLAIQPFFNSASDQNKFDFTDIEFIKNSQKAVKELADCLIYSPPPYSLVFLHRKLGGIYSVLKKMEVKLDVSDYWKKMLEYSSIK